MPPTKLPSRLVSRTIRVLRQALSPKRRRRSVKLGVAHGLLTPFLNEKRRKHGNTSQHGSVTKEAARLRMIWKREFDDVHGRQGNHGKVIGPEMEIREGRGSFRQAGKKRRRLPTGKFLEKEAAPTEPLGSSHSLFNLVAFQ